MNSNNIKRRRPYCHEDTPPEPPVLQELPHFPQQSQQQPPPPAPSLHRQPRQTPSSPLDAFPSQQELVVVQQAATILGVPVQKLLSLRVPYTQPQQPQQVQPHSEHQVQQQPADSAIPGHQFKRPRLSSSTSDANMFLQRNPQPASGPSQDIQEKGEDQASEDMVVTQRSYNFPQSSLTSVTLSITNCMGSLFCPPFDSPEYPSPMAAPSQFGYVAGRPFEDAKPPVGEQVYDATSTAPSEPTQPAATLFTTGPMDDAQISYMPHYPAMQPTPQGTLSIQPPRAEEMVYQPIGSPLGTYYQRQQGGPPEATEAGRAPDGLIHATNTESAVIPVNPDQSTVVGHDGVMIPATPVPGMPPRQGSVVQHGPATPQARFPENTPYIYGHGMYTADQYPGYDVVWPPGGRPPSAKRGPFKNNADREKTAQTRRIGSCIRCRMQRIRCHINEDDEKGPCLTCAKVANSKVWRLPCLRYKITDIQLFKPGKQVEGCEWTRRWTEGVVDDIANWRSMDIKVIHVSEGFSKDKWVKLEVREFIPQEGDKLERSWIGPDGSRRSVKIPPYAICDTHKAKDEYQRYIDETIIDCFNFVLGPSSDLLQRTYRIALSRSQNPAISEKERKLLQTTLRLWMSIRLTTRSAIIVGEETLGMTTSIMDATSPLAGKIPLPPVMGAQIDLILINQIQKQWRKDALEMLQDMVQNNKQKTWMTTYLVTYMLLHNTALITAHDAGYARKHGIPRRFAREAMVGKYHEGANVLLAYWHYCNKSVYPFSKQCKDSEFQQLASLDENTMQFIRVTREMVNQKKPQWAEIQNSDNSEDDYYFISQMYEENWKPRESLPIGGGLRIHEERSDDRKG